MSFSVPTSWGELTQEQLRFVIRVCTLYQGRKDGMSLIKTAVLFHFMGVRIDGEQKEGILCWKPATKERFLLDAELLPWMFRSVEFLEHTELMTDRIETLHGFHAVDFRLLNLPFGNYLIAENYFQGWLQTQDDNSIGAMFRILYQVPDHVGSVRLTDYDRTAVILWWGAVKYRYGQMFPHFLKPGEGSADAPEQRELMDAQIRLLTKGDVTKEDLILKHTNTLRALTELDAQAHEAEELDRMMKKNQ